MVDVMGGINIIWQEANRDFSHRWRQHNPGKEVLPKGWRKAEGRRPLDEDVVFESDVCITLRDGVKIWADVFRPVTADGSRVPAILAWSPYGKQGNGMQALDNVPWRAGVPRDATSDLEKFEALDPAEWCPRGYAIVNLDSRGVFDSDGDMYSLGTQVHASPAFYSCTYTETLHCIGRERWVRCGRVHRSPALV
ncbi:hypothetical protein ANO11243_061720 [Dothideomycetidae sp. 11243]|nr:hypothetical protein ANO11243_061720 [fungal sp. No.11243]